MKRKHYLITFLVILLLVITIGCLKGCGGTALPKQRGLTKEEKKKVSKEKPFNKDSTITIPAGAHYRKGIVHQWVFGKQHRDIWSLPVNMPLFDVKTEKGGMKILKRGGNMQTLSMHMKAKDGKRYVLRTIDKDQSKTLPNFWRKTFCTYIMRDETSALHPYGALVLPKLAEAAGVFHTNPELFFVPYDPNFDKFSNLFEGRVVMLEEFPDNSWIHLRKFGYADSIQSSESMLAKRYSKQNISFDQLAYARARLFDLWIGDWDRHTGQWKWAEYNNNGHTSYKPIPRDRDIAFFKFDSGLIPKIAVTINPKFQSFTYDYNIQKLVINAHYIDHVILNSLTEKDFERIAEDLQKKLTDSVIAEAIKTWPKEVYELDGAKTISKLKVRRDKLKWLASGLYRELFSKIKIIGTDEKEKFVIERINDRHTSVKIYNAKDSLYFDHVYDNNITKEINVFGLNNNDEFIIKGQVKKGVNLNLFGGEDNDQFTDESFVDGEKKLTKIYDSTGTEIKASEETEDNTSDDPEILEFDRVGIKKKE